MNFIARKSAFLFFIILDNILYTYRYQCFFFSFFSGLSSIRFRTMGTDPFHEPDPKEELLLSDVEEDGRNDNSQQIQSKKRTHDNGKKDDDNHNRPAKKRFVCNF